MKSGPVKQLELLIVQSRIPDSDPMQPTPSDGDLLRRLGSGDEDAFLTLYRRHQGTVYRFALRMSGKTEIADEVTQEVFLEFMRGKSRFDPQRGAFASFLYGVARNHVLRALQRERPYAESLDDPGSDVGDVSESVGDVLGDLTRGERMESLRQAVLGLPVLYREVVVLCEFDEMDYADAAIALSCPVGTVRSRLHRARALLVQKMRAGERCPA